MKRKPPRTNKQAFEAILALYPRRYDAKARLAHDLGLTRQAIQHYGDRGIPPKHWPRLKELHGLTPEYICPEYF